MLLFSWGSHWEPRSVCPSDCPPLARRAGPRDRGSPPVPSDGPGNCAGVRIQESFSISGSEKSPGNGTDCWRWPPALVNAACDLDTSSEGVVPSSGFTHGGQERPLSLQGGAALPSAPAEDLGPGPEAGTGCEALRGQAPWGVGHTWQRWWASLAGGQVLLHVAESWSCCCKKASQTGGLHRAEVHSPTVWRPESKVKVEVGPSLL